MEILNIYTSGIINAYNSENNRNEMKNIQQIDIAAPVLVGCVKSLGTLR